MKDIANKQNIEKYFVLLMLNHVSYSLFGVHLKNYTYFFYPIKLSIFISF